MLERKITVKDVRTTLENGEIINDYPNDKPYPSMLLLGYIAERPLHIVAAQNQQDNSCIIVTVYQPDTLIWKDGFKIKH